MHLYISTQTLQIMILTLRDMQLGDIHFPILKDDLVIYGLELPKGSLELSIRQIWQSWVFFLWVPPPIVVLNAFQSVD